jgi:hypothetical protein
MAGAGYKLFQTGDVLTAAQVNTYLNEQTVMVFASAAARTSALTSVLAEGMVSYLQDTNAVEVYDGSAWVSIGASGDITGVTAGTGISGGGTSGTVTITNSMATEITAAGDIIVGTGSGTFDNLPIGTTGQVLTADTTVSPYKVKWATAASSTPTFVGCVLYNSANFSVANNSDVKVTYNSEVLDTDGFHSTSSNTSRITIPAGKGGKYLFFAWGAMAANATGYRQTYFWVNNNSATRFANIKANPISASLNADFYVSGVVDLVATDYVEHIMYQNSGGNLNLIGAQTDGQFGCIYLGA